MNGLFKKTSSIHKWLYKIIILLLRNNLYFFAEKKDILRFTDTTIIPKKRDIKGALKILTTRVA